MADLSFLFGGNAPSSFLSVEQGSNQTPLWLQTAMQGLTGRAAEIANEPYQAYQGPKVAPTDMLSKGAYDYAHQTLGKQGIADMMDATSTAKAGGQLFNEDDFSKFLSPYTGGVVDEIARLGNRNMQENLLPSINDTFVSSGMPFGSRHEDFTARALRDTNESILGAQANALQNAFSSAMGNYQNAQGRQLQSASTLGALTGQSLQNDTSMLNTWNTLGNQQQANVQKNLDTALQDFNNQQNWDLRGLDIVNSILKGYSPGTNATKYQTQPVGGSTAQTPSLLSSIPASLQGILGSPQGLG